MIELVKYKAKAVEYEKENRNIRIFDLATLNKPW